MLSEPLALGAMGVAGIAATWAACRLDRAPFAVRPLGALRVLPLLAAAALVPFVPPHPSWAGVASGLIFLVVGVAAMWGDDIARWAYWYGRPNGTHARLEAAARPMARPRNARHMGRALVAISVGLAGWTTEYAAISAAFVVAAAVQVAADERRWRLAGRHRSLVEPFWSVRGTLSFTTVAGAAFATGATMDGDWVWISAGGYGQDGGALLLQALLAALLGLFAIGAAAIGVALQLRASHFGMAVAWALLPTRRIFAVLMTVVAVALATLWMLGRWGDLHSESGSLLSSVAVQLSIVAAGATAWATATVLWALVRDRNLDELLGELVARGDWAAGIGTYGLNAWQEPRLPESIYLLERSLLGAMRQGDSGLFDALVLRWIEAARRQAPVSTLDDVVEEAQRGLVGDARVASARAAVADPRLDAADADFFYGLDVGLARMTVALEKAAHFEAYAPHLAPLVGILYPPIGPGEPPYDGRSRGAPPGFRFLRRLALNLGADDDSRDRVFRRWRWCTAAAITWAEREWSDEPHRASVYAERCFVGVAAMADAHPFRPWVIEVLVAGVESAREHHTIFAGLRELDRLEPYGDIEWAHHFGAMGSIATRLPSPHGLLTRMFSSTVAAEVHSDVPLLHHQERALGEWWAAIVAGLDGAAQRRDIVDIDVAYMDETRELALESMKQLAGHWLSSPPRFGGSVSPHQRQVVDTVLAVLPPHSLETRRAILAFVRDWAAADDGRGWARDVCDKYESANPEGRAYPTTHPPAASSSDRSSD